MAFTVSWTPVTMLTSGVRPRAGETPAYTVERRTRANAQATPTAWAEIATGLSGTSFEDEKADPSLHAQYRVSVDRSGVIAMSGWRESAWHETTEPYIACPNLNPVRPGGMASFVMEVANRGSRPVFLVAVTQEVSGASFDRDGNVTLRVPANFEGDELEFTIIAQFGDGDRETIRRTCSVVVLGDASIRSVSVTGGNTVLDNATLALTAEVEGRFDTLAYAWSAGAGGSFRDADKETATFVPEAFTSQSRRRREVGEDVPQAPPEPPRGLGQDTEDPISCGTLDIVDSVVPVGTTAFAAVTGDASGGTPPYTYVIVTGGEFTPPGRFTYFRSVTIRAIDSTLNDEGELEPQSIDCIVTWKVSTTAAPPPEPEPLACGTVGLSDVSVETGETATPSVTGAATGGKPPYTYSTNASYTPQEAGEFARSDSVTVTDANNDSVTCLADWEVTATDPQPPEPEPEPTCTGGRTWNPTTMQCECPEGMTWDGTKCVDEPTPEPTPTPPPALACGTLALSDVAVQTGALAVASVTGDPSGGTAPYTITALNNFLLTTEAGVFQQAGTIQVVDANGVSTRCPADFEIVVTDPPPDPPPEPTCTGGRTWNPTTRQCECPEGMTWDGTKCVDEPEPPPECTGGRVWNATTMECECPDGKIWDATAQMCVDAPEPEPPDPEPEPEPEPEPTPLSCGSLDLSNVSVQVGQTATASRIGAATGGTSPYTYAVEGNTFAPTGPGTFNRTGKITVTDSAGAKIECTANWTVTATAAPPGLPLSCGSLDLSDVTVEAGTEAIAERLGAATGGTGPYTYTLSGNTFTPDRAGTFNQTGKITVKDAAGTTVECTVGWTVTATAPAARTRKVPWSLKVTATGTGTRAANNTTASRTVTGEVTVTEAT